MCYYLCEIINAADIGKKGSCHLFRHTMATLMLENGADVRFIQSMLAHAKLETTGLYTQVSIRKLKEIHELTHPAARNEAGKAKKVADELKKESEAENKDDSEDDGQNLAAGAV